jgi:hypothetical protein
MAQARQRHFPDFLVLDGSAGRSGRLHPSRAAEGNQPPVVTQRMIHVCDCPSALASDERNNLLQAFAKRGFEQGRNLDLVTYDVTALGTESSGRGPCLCWERTRRATHTRIFFRVTSRSDDRKSFLHRAYAPRKARER